MNFPEKLPKELPPRMIDTHPIKWLFLTVLMFFLALVAIPIVLWLVGSSLPVR